MEVEGKKLRKSYQKGGIECGGAHLPSQHWGGRRIKSLRPAWAT
jgi:hypothetical protein